MTGEKIILFDGVCNLCNGAVNFAIKRDRTKSIKFASLQGNAGQRLLKKYNLPVRDISSFVFIENGVAYTRSTAALKVCKYLTAWWPLLYGFIIVPGFIRDGVYNQVAIHRYRWFGRQDACSIPAPGISDRFLT